MTTFLARPSSLVQLTRELFQGGVKAIVLDLDGTLWSGDRLIDGAVEFWDWALTHAVNVVLLSNTGERRREDVRNKFEQVMGRTILTSQIWTALDNIAGFLNRMVDGDEVDVVYIIAPERNRAWREFSFAARCVEFDPALHHNLASSPDRRCCMALLSDGRLNGDYQLTVACVAEALLNGVPLYVTSDDDTITVNAPSSDRRRMIAPGPGIFAQNVAVLTRHVPDAHERIRFFGKGTDPRMPLKALELLRELGYVGPISQVHFVGDRLDADVRAAFQVGGTAVHVETGCHGPSRYLNFPHDVPHVAARDIRELIDMFCTSEMTQLRNRVRDRILTASHRIRRGDLGDALRSVGALVRMPPRRIQSLPNLASLDSLGDQPEG